MMEVLKLKQLTDNYSQLIEYIEKYTSGIKKTNLLSLYDSLAERMITAPASSTKGFHGAYPGGYVQHVLKVVELSLKIYELWQSSGAVMTGYTKNELVFAAINHDLGKIGDIENEYYLPNPSDWHVKNQGKIYTSNPDIQNMTVPDRSLFILQEANIPVTQNEWIAIRVHDGLFDDANKQYWMSWDTNKKFKNNMPCILHQADYSAFRIEYETDKALGLHENDIQAPKKQTKTISNASDSALDIFDSIFKKNSEE